MHLTNSPSDPYSVSAESAGAEAAGAPDEIEIEITPEMIRAGEMAVLDCVGDIIPAVGGEAPDLARAVYLAMRTCYARSAREPKSSRSESRID